MSIRETVGKKLALLAGYDIDGLVSDGNYYAACCRKTKVALDTAIVVNQLNIETVYRLQAEREEARAWARRLLRERDTARRQFDGGSKRDDERE